MKTLISFCLVCTSLHLFGQETKTINIDFYKPIIKYNLKELWKADSIGLECGNEKSKFPEPYGFIGSNYHRFYIHYTSVVKSKNNPYVYFVKGKTRVNNIVRTFNGTIQIDKAKLIKYFNVKGEELFENCLDSNFRLGYVQCKCLFFEDSTMNETGFINGILTTNWYLDKRNRIHYDALEIVADGFCNNQFIGYWTSYKKNKIKKCNWGDFRIPDCGDLDIGAGDVVINDKYIANGWASYMKQWDDTLEGRKAKKEEELKWWK